MVWGGQVILCHFFALCSLLFPVVFNLPVLTFHHIQLRAHIFLYEFPSELRFHNYTLHCFALILHHFASHHTATIPLSLLVKTHLEMIPCPHIAPLRATQDLCLDLQLHRSLLHPRHITMDPDSVPEFCSDACDMLLFRVQECWQVSAACLYPRMFCSRQILDKESCKQNGRNYTSAGVLPQV